MKFSFPFCKLVAGDFKLVPIVMGEQRKESCVALAKALVSAVEGNNCLIVGSTDLSHFLNAETAERLDNIIRENVEKFDPDGLLADISRGKCQACGGGPMAVVMMACKELGAEKSTVLNMADSGDITGETNSVVGYMAAALSIPDPHGENKVKVGIDLGLSDSEKTVLRNVVDQTLETVVNGGNVPVYDNYSGKLGEKRGAFVTLTKKGELQRVYREYHRHSTPYHHGCGNDKGCRARGSEVPADYAVGTPRYRI